MGDYSHFITNRGKTLYESISNLSNSVQNIYTLVGFFYFSGFFKLKEEFKDKNIKILIGLDIDKHTGRFIKEYEILSKENKSRDDIKNNFYEALLKTFSFSDNFETPEIKESFEIFAEKIQKGTIEVRKTKEPNHAKLYMFENKPEYSQNGDYPGTIITGSSNLSIEGLEKRFEIDIISRDKAHYAEAKKIFDDLWKDSIPVATKENYDEFKKSVLDKVWPTYKLPTPYEVYIRVLKEYFALAKSHIRIPKEIFSKWMNLAYQNDAIALAVETIKKHNGAIIADVVGLGKSIIAIAVAHNLNLDTVIIAPPHLVEQWKEYKRNAGLIGEVYSIGKIKDAIEHYSSKEGRKLIIVDEAHRYRNTDTINYHYLWLLSQGNYVLLLTATPFNNTPQDIESLIKLFQSPAKSTLKHIDDLSLEFQYLVKKYSELKKTSKNLQKEQIKQKADEIAKRIRYIISPITIRRTRIDLIKTEKYRKDLERQNIVFPKVNPPDIISYSFKELDELYLETVEQFIENESGTSCFKASRYKAISYIEDKDYKTKIALEYTKAKTKKEALAFIDQSQKNLSSLIKRIFVKRFESSFGSFSQSIEDYIKSHKKIEEYYSKGKIPIYKKIEDIPSPSELDELDIEEREQFFQKFEELENQEELIWIESSKLSKDFIKDLENDIGILEDIKKKWERFINNPSRYDFKLHKLIQILEEKVSKGEKVIIFSEYSDTVDYLKEQLKDRFGVLSYYSAVKSNELKKEIEENFNASIQENKKKDDYDILITTDILSEGINLHRANNIINYDIPYNPTRVIQRIGRVNRISKLKLKDIFIYNFFPTGIGEEHIRIKNISTLKMHMIHFLLGEDIQYLTSEEDVRSFFYEEYKNSSYFEEESWDVKYRNILYDIEESQPDIFQKACEIPYRVKIKRIKPENTLALTFAKKGENFIFKAAIKDGNSYKMKTLSDEEAIKLFEATKDEQSFEASKQFYEIYTQIRKNIFETTSLKPKDRWEREILEKTEILERNAKDYYPEYTDYISKLKKLIELEVLPEYIIRIIRKMPVNSKEAVKELSEKLPKFHIDEVFDRIRTYQSSEDIIILSEEFSDK